MRRSSQNHHPVDLAGVLVLAFLAATVMALLLLGAIEYAYRRLGIGEGALIPTGLSAYLVIKDDIWWQALIGVLVVASVVHAAARPVTDVGIVVPGLVSPVLAAGSALIVAPTATATATAAVAYAAGSLGTLIGGDLLNLRRLRDLGGGVVSIGGAGTFDGVFLSGIMAVVLVGIT